MSQRTAYFLSKLIKQVTESHRIDTRLLGATNHHHSEWEPLRPVILAPGHGMAGQMWCAFQSLLPMSASQSCSTRATSARKACRRGPGRKEALKLASASAASPLESRPATRRM